MLKGFEFAADGRTYVCTIEERRGMAGEFWWWFTVTGDQSMYAPFRVTSADTRDSVRERVVAYYTNRVWKRAQPPERGSQWGRRGPSAVKPVTPPVIEAPPEA